MTKSGVFKVTVRCLVLFKSGISLIQPWCLFYFSPVVPIDWFEFFRERPVFR